MAAEPVGHLPIVVVVCRFRGLRVVDYHSFRFDGYYVRIHEFVRRYIYIPSLPP
jgi:hypothetical protein